MSFLQESDLTGHLKKSGFTIQPESQTRYFRGIAALFDEPDTLLNLIQQPPFIRLFCNAQIRKGRAYTVSQLYQIAQPGESTQGFYAQLQDLLATYIFYRVYAHTCSVCGIETIYRLSDLSESMTCDGCRTTVPLPLEPDLSLLLNPLLREGFKAGMLTVLLTLLYYQRTFSFTRWQSGIVLSKAGDTTDIDLLIYCDSGVVPQLHLIECKDRIRMDANSLTALDRQLLTGRTIADQIGARFTLSVLSQDGHSSDFDNMLDQYRVTLLDESALLPPDTITDRA